MPPETFRRTGLCTRYTFFHEHSYRQRKLVKTEKTYYLCCQSRQNICKFVVNAKRLLLLLLLQTESGLIHMKQNQQTQNV